MLRRLRPRHRARKIILSTLKIAAAAADNLGMTAEAALKLALSTPNSQTALFYKRLYNVLTTPRTEK